MAQVWGVRNRLNLDNLEQTTDDESNTIVQSAYSFTGPENLDFIQAALDDVLDVSDTRVQA